MIRLVMPAMTAGLSPSSAWTRTAKTSFNVWICFSVSAPEEFITPAAWLTMHSKHPGNMRMGPLLHIHFGDRFFDIFPDLFISIQIESFLRYFLGVFKRYGAD